MMNQFLPCRYFISECLHHHNFPLWCPYINFGYPFYADPQSGVFYPFTWLISFALGYNAYTIGLEYVLHVTIAAISFFYLLKKCSLDNFTAVSFAIVYCLSGVFIGNAQHLPWIVTMAWLPLVLLGFKNMFDAPGIRTALALALFLYLALTGGYPGFFIILFYFFTLYGAVKLGTASTGRRGVMKVVLFFVLTGIVFAILAGGYLYSFSQALPFIARGKPVSLVEANNVAVSPHSLVSILFPFATAAANFRLYTYFNGQYLLRLVYAAPGFNCIIKNTAAVLHQSRTGVCYYLPYGRCRQIFCASHFALQLFTRHEYAEACGHIQGIYCFRAGFYICPWF